MARIVVPIIGGTGPDDPRRINLPTWSMIRELRGGTYALVEIPDDDAPPGEAFAQLAPTPEGGRDVEQLPLVAIRNWGDVLDAKYREHAGRFRPLERRSPRSIPRG